MNLITSLKENRTESYLKLFAQQANEWFSKRAWLLDRFNFYNQFYKEENLKKAEWSDIQKLGENIHAFQSLAIAKGNALGEPNLPIEDGFEHSFTIFGWLTRKREQV